MSEQRLTKDLAKTVSLSTVGFIWTHWALPSLLVAGSPIMVGVSAYFANVQWHLVFLCALLAFASAAVGVYFADLEVSRRILKGKLHFESVWVGRSIQNPNGTGLCVGFVFRNSSDFPIQFKLNDIRTNIDNFFPPKKGYANRAVTISPHGSGWFCDHEILIGEPPKNKTLQGSAEISLDYGRPNNVRHADIHKKTFFIAFDEAGNIKAVSWQEAFND